MPPAPYIAFYDAHCRLCSRSKQTIQRMDGVAPIRWIDLNDDARMRDFPMIDRAAARGQMFVLDPDRRLTGGYDAVVTLLKNTRLFRPVAPLLDWGPIRSIGWRVYRWIATNRYRFFGAVECTDACAMPPR